MLISVTIPPTAGWGARDVATLTARSAISPALVQTAVLTSKAPAPILLVDDDLFYEQRGKYEAALTAAGLPYDLWQTHAVVGPYSNDSPPLAVLQRYPIVVWWTGYDWYRPVTADEEATLVAYLAGGGRLLLSSQDFLYYHHDGSLSRDFFGLLDYTEDVTPTLAWGAPEDPIGDGLGPWELDYPFRNLSDNVEPAPGVAVPFRDQQRRGVALAHRQDKWAALFLAFPFEALPVAARPVAMERVVGWLSWLGASSFSADRGAVAPGDAVTYVLQVRNDGPTTVTAALSNTLPLSLTLLPGSLDGPATYLSLTHCISWVGQLGPQAGVAVTYQAVVTAALPAGALLTNTAGLGLEEQSIRFTRAAVVRAGAPDLTASTRWFAPAPARPAAVVTCVLVLHNSGPGHAVAATVTSTLPVGGAPVSGSLVVQGGGAAEWLTNAVHWAGPLDAGGRVTLTYRLALPGDPLHPPLYSVAFIEDGVGGRWERPLWFVLEPRRCYLPLVLRGY